MDMGAAALVVERSLNLPVPQMQVRNVNLAMGPLAAAFYGWPSRELVTIGVTGTNGKTTTCELLRACMEAAGWASGQIGTIETRIGDTSEPAELTTPEAPDLQATLRRMVDAGVRGVAMEISSHALDRHRVEGTCYDVAVFTNLSPEHLDYHGTIEQYWSSKAQLFEPQRCKQAVVCIDDEWGRRLASQVRIPVITFGSRSEADVRVASTQRGLAGTIVELDGIDGGVELRSRLVGTVNATDVAAAYLAARTIGLSAEHAKAGIERCPPPAGRFELVEAGQPFLVVVDYAHTPDALESLIRTARTLVAPNGRVHLVVGGRGGKDRFKRPRIGHVAALADTAVFTADSPGHEDPRAIIEELHIGALEVPGADIVAEPDRRAAIAIAIEHAAPGDAVLIVGRGHERVFHIGERTIAFDDRNVARSALQLSSSLHPDGTCLPARAGRPAAPAPVSVVIAAHNAADTVTGAISSALSQTLTPLEVIVVDDGSSDHTAELARTFGDPIRVISQSQRGPSAARNVGIVAARGRWVAFLDADDQWHPSKLEFQLAALQSRPETVLVASDWSRDIPRAALPSVIAQSIVTTRDLLVLNRFQTSTVLVERDVVLRVGGFDPRLDGAEDWDMWLRTSRAGGIIKLDWPFVQYTDSPAGYSKNLERVYETMLVMLDREFGDNRTTRSPQTIYAWHFLRWAVAFGLANDSHGACRCLSDLRSHGLGTRAPAATVRYLVPFLARRAARHLNNSGTRT
jgi:UDP-N-acetylmuramoyl-L-alanyl-D-glutamate--2,6-diaminopimelate ligase